MLSQLDDPRQDFSVALATDVFDAILGEREIAAQITQSLTPALQKHISDFDYEMQVRHHALSDHGFCFGGSVCVLAGQTRLVSLLSSSFNQLRSWSAMRHRPGAGEQEKPLECLEMVVTSMSGEQFALRLTLSKSKHTTSALTSNW